MQQWQFRINGKLLIPGSSSSEDNTIRPENIKDIVRISNYVEKNMPTMLMKVNLDKNLLDKVIQNSKTATIYLKIEKYNTADNNTTPMYETLIEDEFSIFVSNDINYYKDIDYIDKSATGKDRKDVYKEAYLGLMSKKCIDANKCLANTTMYGTTMQDMVVSYMKDLHLLIEPFEYNKPQTQLIIPPMDTLVKVVNYLNDIQVFYSTKPLFFIDEPNCTYLISRSGKGVASKNEQYNDVVFNVRKTTDRKMAVQGMDTNTDEKNYAVDISVADTNYNINHDVAKVVDRIDAIVNPSKDNSIQSYDNIMQTKLYIDKIIQRFKDSVKSIVANMGDAPGRLKSWNDAFRDNVLNKAYQLKKYEDDLVNMMVSQCVAIPTSVDAHIGDSVINVPVVEDAIKSACSEFAKNHLNVFNGLYNQLNDLSNKFDKSIQSSAPLFYNATYLDNYLNAVTEVNVQDVINQTKSAVSRLNNSSLINYNQISNNVFGKMGILNDLGDNIASAAESMANFNAKLQSVQSTYGKYIASEVNTQFDDFNYNTERIAANVQELAVYTTAISRAVNDFNAYLNVFTTGISGLISFFTGFDTIASWDLKSKFVSLVVDTRVLTEYPTSVFDKLSNVNLAMNTTYLNYNDLKVLRENLNQVSDLTGIGRLGVSDISSNVYVGNKLGSSKIGTKIIVSGNDNPNDIKNYKHELETSINKLSLTKYDLDPSVFTPNKRYVVKNYEAHSDKDGIFILNKKTEVYTREADNFRCITMLELSKILEESNTQKAVDTNNTNNNTTTEDWYAKSQGQDVNKSGSVSTNSSTGTGLLVDQQTNRSSDTVEIGKQSMTDTANTIKNSSISDLEKMGLILH